MELEEPNSNKMCVYCGEEEAAHMENFTCVVCYSRKPMTVLMESECGSCKVCKDCMFNQIIVQFERQRVQNFICVCGKQLSDEFASKCLDEAQLKKLARMRLGRKIDEDPNLIWCPYLGCE